jgi:hypothetical protein
MMKSVFFLLIVQIHRVTEVHQPPATTCSLVVRGCCFFLLSLLAGFSLAGRLVTPLVVLAYKLPTSERKSIIIIISYYYH